MTVSISATPARCCYGSRPHVAELCAFLQQLGVDTNALKIVSYGKERPQCTDQNEACWKSNRRVHFAAGQ